MNGKKTCDILASVLLICFLTLLIGVQAKAVTPEELRDKWRDKLEYPVKFLEDDLYDDGFGHMLPKASDEWMETLKQLGSIGVTYALNPPEDILNGLSSEELASLFQTWPWIHLVDSYNDDGDHYERFFQFAELNSDIFFELLGREDGYVCILEAYRNNKFDINANNENPLFCYSLDLTEKAEVFGCQFIRYYHHHFTRDEYDLACEIIKEKLVIYEKLNDESLAKRRLNLSEIDFGEDEMAGDVRANYYTSAKRQETWAGMMGAASDEQYPAQENNGVSASEEEKETSLSGEQENEERQNEIVTVVDQEAGKTTNKNCYWWFIISIGIVFGGVICVCFITKTYKKKRKV